ncbi:hypothetical protein [Halosimplex marinum]|uniref:hypothetical protein n=1 Tax=Halosimplex marinum TaxID=3396620 RepID=UPI003F571454
MEDNERSRRRFLRASGLLGAAGLAGCTGVLEETTATPPDVGEASDVEPLVPTESPTPTASPTPEETATETASPTPEPPSEPTPPEPDFVVAADGSGDYDTVEKAKRVARAGAVIELKDGSYTWPLDQSESDLTVAKPLEFVGAGRDSTTLTVDSDPTEISSQEALTFWDLTLESAGDRYFYVDAPVTANYVRYRVPTRGWRGNLTVYGSFRAYESQIDLPDSTVSVRGLNLTSCAVDTSVYFEGGISATDCGFAGPVRLSDAGGRIHDCSLDAGVTLVDTDSSNLTITNSVLHPDGDGYAVRMENGPGRWGPTVLNSTVRGRIGETEDGTSGCRLLEGNVFRADDIDADYFVDGRGASFIYRNAFRGADIRIDEATVAVDADWSELGNYYPTYDNADEDGDGVIDLPRPIPGEGKVTDRYSLVNPDLSEYPPTDADLVMRLFIRNRDSAFFESDIREETGVDSAALDEILPRLEELGAARSDGDYWGVDPGYLD